MIEILAFYEFKDLAAVAPLQDLKLRLRAAMVECGVRGTIIISHEGFNGMICGPSQPVAKFVSVADSILETRLTPKVSFNNEPPFRRTEIKIKPEIVTLKKEVDISLASGTHVAPEAWNQIISDPETLVLDTRNDYEYATGTFTGAVNPRTTKFSDLPDYVASHLDPARHKRIAMFCTGGIRCEKFAPYMKQLGFEEVYQLEGGILKYLEIVSPEDSLWQGECFVFDDRVSVDHDLRKGTSPDHSHRKG